jgi:hypothetical protein
MVCHEYMVAGLMRIGEVDVLPVVEIRVDVGAICAIHSCVAQARPIGFAILLHKRGYWMAYPQDLTLLADAVHKLTSNAGVAS